VRRAMVPLLVTPLAAFSTQRLLTPVLAPLARELTLTETQLGLVITIGAATMTAASPLWGHVLRRLRLRTVLLLGLGLTAAGRIGAAQGLSLVTGPAGGGALAAASLLLPQRLVQHGSVAAARAARTP